MATNINYDNLFSATVEDRVEDVYLLAMEAMDDRTLQAYCTANRYTNKICDNEAFWLRRIKEAGLSSLLPYRSLYKNLQAFYFNVLKDAFYIVVDPGLADCISDISVFSTIQGALGHIKAQIMASLDNYTSMTSLQDPREVNIDGNVTINYEKLQRYSFLTNYTIIIMFKDAIVDELSLYTLYSIKRGHSKYLADISTYPDLLSTGPLLYKIVETVEGPWEDSVIQQIIVTSFDDIGIRSIKDITLENTESTWDKSIGTTVVDSDRNMLWTVLPLGMSTLIYKGSRPIRKLILLDLDAPFIQEYINIPGITGYVLIVIPYFERNIVEYLIKGTKVVATNYPEEKLRHKGLDVKNIFPLTELENILNLYT